MMMASQVCDEHAKPDQGWKDGADNGVLENGTTTCPRVTGQQILYFENGNKVSDDHQMSGNNLTSDYEHVSEYNHVSDNQLLCDSQLLNVNNHVSDNVHVSGNYHVSEYSYVSEYNHMSENNHVADNQHVSNDNSLNENHLARQEHHLCQEDNYKNIHDDQRGVTFIFSPSLVRICDRLTKIRGRAALVHGLIEAYDLMPKMELLSPKICSKDELTKFHSQDYIECLQKLSDQSCDIEKYDDEMESFGLGYDCPAFPGVYEYSALVAGATVAAAQQLNLERCQVAINWFGGWHHAKRDAADGYCYINDIVLGILKLRERFERVLYVDLDLHHGDGVEDAFSATAKVLTWSIHKLSPGFFPGTGRLEDIGFGRGKYFTLNTPLSDGIDDKTYFRVFQRIACKIREQFEPKAVVIQCGADGLATDPCNSFNLSSEVYARCLRLVLSWRIPTLIVGGGGYNLADTAKCWTHLTGVVLGRELDAEIPEHDHLLEYGPDYSLSVSSGNRANMNCEADIENLIQTSLDNLDEIRV